MAPRALVLIGDPPGSPEVQEASEVLEVQEYSNDTGGCLFFIPYVCLIGVALGFSIATSEDQKKEVPFRDLPLSPIFTGFLATLEPMLSSS